MSVPSPNAKVSSYWTTLVSHRLCVLMWASCRINSDSGCSVTGTWVYGSRPSLGVSGCRWLWPSRRYQRRGTVARTCFPACRLEFTHTHTHEEEDKSLMPLVVRGLGFFVLTSPSFPFSILNWFISVVEEFKSLEITLVLLQCISMESKV